MKKLRKSFRSFKELNKKEKKMLLLGLLRSCGEVIFLIFMNVYTYQIFQGWSGLIRGNIIHLTAILLGFLSIAFLRSKMTINLKYFSVLGAAFFAISYLCFFTESLSVILISYLLQGLAAGCWRCARNNYKFIIVRKKERGVFQGNMSTINSIGKILLSLCISGIFLGSEYFLLPAYYILGVIAIVFSIVVMYLCFSLPDQYEQQSALSKPSTVLSQGNATGRAYLSLVGIDALFDVIFPISSYVILTSEVGLGSYESLVTTLALGLTLYFGKQIKEQNRVKYLFRCCSALCLVFLLFSFTISWWSFILLTIAKITVLKLFHLTEAVNSMSVVESLKQEGESCFSILTYRQIGFYLVRIIGLGILLPFVDAGEFSLIKYSFVVLAVGYLGIGLLLKRYSYKQVQQTSLSFSEKEKGYISVQPAFLHLRVDSEKAERVKVGK